MHRCTWSGGCNAQSQIVYAGHCLPADFFDDISFLQTRLGARTIRAYVADQGSFSFRGFESLGQVGRDLLDDDTEISARHFSVLENLVHHPASHVDGNGESDALIAPTTPSQNRGVDSDQLTSRIDQRATGVARVDRGVGLNEVFIIFDVQVPTSLGTHDPHGRGLPDTKRVADCKYVVAHLKLVGIAERKSGQSGRRDFHYRDICFWIAAHNFAFELTLVGKRYLDVSRLVDHMIVGEDVTVSSDDDARPETMFSLLAWQPARKLIAEKLAEERIIEERLERDLRSFHDPRR